MAESACFNEEGTLAGRVREFWSNYQDLVILDRR